MMLQIQKRPLLSTKEYVEGEYDHKHDLEDTNDEDDCTPLLSTHKRLCKGIRNKSAKSSNEGMKSTIDFDADADISIGGDTDKIIEQFSK